MLDFLQNMPGWAAQTWMTYSFMFPVTLAQSLMLGFVVLAVMIPFRMLNFPDLTSEGAYPFGACVCAALMVAGWPAWAAAAGAVLAGFVAGCCTAFIHLRFRIHPLLAGILMINILYSINLRVMGKSNLPIRTDHTLFNWVSFVASPDRQKILVAGALGLIVFCLLLLFFRTEKGVATRAVGANPEMAEAQGINVWVATVGGVGLASGFSALSGALMTNSQGFADVGIGAGILIKSLAALMIGEALVGKQTLLRQVVAAFVGALVYYQLESLLLAAQVNPSDLKMVTGLFVLVMLALPVLRGARAPTMARETMRE